jgi:hypothetical protein
MKRSILFFSIAISLSFKVIFSSQLLFDKEKDFITCSQEGELGNFLFRAATCINFAIKQDYEFFSTKRYITMYPKILSRLRAFDGARTIEHHKNMNYLDSIGANILPNTLISGYPHSYLYFDENKITIQSLFSPSEDIKKDLFNRFNPILTNKEKYVGIHLRTFHRPSDKCLLFNPLQTPTYLPCSFEYYDRAINYFGNDFIYVVFSDNVQVARKILEKYSCTFIFMENTKLYEDFYLMSLLDNLIISNSTFAWWAAYINTNVNKRIVTPWPWYRFRNYSWEYQGKHAICPPDWIEIQQGEVCLDMISQIKAL